MHIFYKTKWCLMVVVTLLFPRFLEAGEVRVSFLQESNALQDTFEFLTNSGCSETNARIFKGIVDLYYSEPFDFKFDKFPNPVDGFYTFYSPQALVAALPHRLPDTDHPFEFNCTDSVILLAANRLKTTLRPDDMVGTFWAPMSTTNGEIVAFAATARDAYGFSRPSWYQDMTAVLIPENLRDDHMCLTASLFTWHLMPAAKTNESPGSKLLESRVLEVLRADWQRDKVMFPEAFEVIMVHNVTPSNYTVCTCHAGLLFPRKTGFTYLEKAGGKGPFVRLDLANKSDLIPWLGTSFTNYTSSNFVHFATFNDTSITKLGPN